MQPEYVAIVLRVGHALLCRYWNWFVSPIPGWITVMAIKITSSMPMMGPDKRSSTLITIPPVGIALSAWYGPFPTTSSLLLSRKMCLLAILALAIVYQLNSRRIRLPRMKRIYRYELKYRKGLPSRQPFSVFQFIL